MNVSNYKGYLLGFIYFSLLLFSVEVLSQTPKIDSLQKVLQTKIDDKKKAITLADLSQEIYYYDSQKSLQYATKSLEIAQKAKSRLGEANAYKALGYYHYYQKELYLSRLFHQYSLSLFKIINNQNGIADSFHNIGLTYFSAGQYEKSLEFYVKSLDIKRELDEESGTVLSLLNIAIVLEMLEKKEEAMKYYQEAFDIAWKYRKHDQLNVIKVSHNLANAHFLRKNYQQALSYTDTTLKYADKAKMEYGIGRAKGMKARIYNATKEADKALKLVIEAEAIFEKLGITTEKVNLLLIKSNAFQLKKDFVNIKNTMLEATKLIPTINDPAIIAQVYSTLHIAHKGLHEYQEALELYEIFESYEDSLFNLEKDKQINELLTKYETEKKEATIQELDKKTKIQALQIERQTYQTVLVIVILLLVLGLAFIFYQQKRLSFQRKLFDLEQKHLRSQLNPHFIFNAINAIQDYFYQKGVEKGNFYLVKFATLMRQILEHSRVNYISLEEEIETIENYIHLQQLRFENQFDYQIHMNDTIDIEEIGIPPMFLQPIVENAIEHGLSKNNKKGELNIYLEKENEYLKVSIQDNGIGITNSLKNKETEHQSLATQIIQERIKIFEQKSKKHIIFEIVDLQTRNELLHGTKVNLQLPYVEL